MTDLAVPAQAGAFFAPGSDAFAAATDRAPSFFGATPDYVGLVRPGSATELAATARFARAERLVVLRLYNDSSVGARLSGAGRTLIVDLGGMNRILEVNPKYAYARVEPGVSYAQLSDHLVRNALPLLVDSERDPGASIAGSIFSKGFGYTPYGDHMMVQCGAEYVLPDGDRLRTGMGAMTDNRAWQLYKYALGPYADGLALQSDLMIPAQTGIWLMGPAPAFRPFILDLADENGLAAAIEALRPLKIANLLPGTIALMHRDFDARRSGQAPRTAAWRLHGALYGLPSVVDLGMNAVQASLGTITGARLLAPEAVAADPLAREQVSLMAGQAGISAVRFSGPGQPHSASLGFVAPVEGSAASAMLELAGRAVAENGLPLLTEFAILGRSLLQTIHMPYDRRDAATVSALIACARSLIPAMGEAGYGLAHESPEFCLLAQSILAASQKPLGALERRIMGAFT